MKLTKIGVSQLSQTKEVAGLLSCEIEYEVKAGKGRLQYKGPKFSHEMWHQVLSFFRWTFTEMKSESQVRLYVNTKAGQWGAWAFPQEARTGMSAREIPIQETVEQAGERFASWNSVPSEDWMYFCTVHHHCSASAFQSGTDEENEQNQDGLHITVGRLDSERHELHARFYLNGNCFEPDLSRFWDIEPAELRDKIPPSMLDELARFQMGEKVEMPFPEAWKDNIVEVKRELNRERLFKGGDDRSMDPRDLPWWIRAENATKDLQRECLLKGYDEEEIIEAARLLSSSSVEALMVEVCLTQSVTPEEILEELKPPHLAF
jgi:hypothetical protein